MTRRRLLAIAAPLLAFLPLLAACEDDVATSDVAGDAPWQAGERAEYRLVDEDDDGDVVGSAVFTVEEDGDAFVLTQDIDTGDVRDTVEVRVDEDTLKPLTTRRVIEEREDDQRTEIESTYVEEEGRAIVRAFDGEERRSASDDVPDHAYDTRQNLFLWRTLPLEDGYDAAYNGVLTTVTSEPDAFKVTVRVRERETITVPAGEFETWRVGATIRGATETAWIGVEAPHPLVKFDNGDTVFELESFEP